MARGTPPEAPLAALLGKGARYSGDLAFDGRVRIDGAFKGRIHTEDVLEIGESGAVEGHIDAATLTIAGSVNGTVKVSGLLTVLRSGRLTGDVDAAQVEVEPGAKLDARVRVG